MSFMFDMEGQLVDAAYRKAAVSVYRKENPYPNDTTYFKNFCYIVNFVLSVCKLVIGAVYYRSCPTNNHIPFYLVVAGPLQLLLMVTMIWKKLKNSNLPPILAVAVLVWFLISSVNIFVEWHPDYFEGAWRYCDRTLYLFAVSAYIIEYILLGLILFLLCVQFAFY